MTVAVTVAPLAVALTLGSLLTVVTLSWGHTFIVWQLLCWSVLSIGVAATTSKLADWSIDAITNNLTDRRLNRLLSITGVLFLLGAMALLEGTAISILVMVTGQVTSAPPQIYWPLPIAAFLLAVAASSEEELSPIKAQRERMHEENSRKKRCSELTSEQRAEYEYKFLTALHSITRSTYVKPIPLSQVSEKLVHECTPELLPRALETWAKQNLIAVSGEPGQRRSLTLMPKGRYFCLCIEVAGMATALRANSGVPQLGDEGRMEFQEQLLRDIARLQGEPQEVVTMVRVLSVQQHPCWPALFSDALFTLKRHSVISIKEKTISIPSYDFMGSATRTVVSGRSDQDTVQLTDIGWSIYHKMLRLGTLDAALDEHDKEVGEKLTLLERQRRQEEARHKRCLEATSQQRVEFEDQFLLALHSATKGDTRPVIMKQIWTHLNHECASELSRHAVKIWLDRGCIRIVLDSRFREDYKDWMLEHRTEELAIALTAAGRDLCMHALGLGSMQEALRQYQKGNAVTQEYHMHGGQVGAFGPYANVHHNEFTQFVNAFDQGKLQELALELETLGRVLNERAETAEEREMAGAVAGAEIAAREGNQQRVWERLAKVGRWVLEVASEISVSVAAEAIRMVLRGYGIPV